MEERQMPVVERLSKPADDCGQLTEKHWIPQALACELKQIRLSMCLHLLPKTRAQ
jgi:hypothetical protein